jgi:beta-galactosidase
VKKIAVILVIVFASMGFFVLDEAFDEWTRGWEYNATENARGKSRYGYHLYFNQWHETDLKVMIWRDRNHPSIVMYSIGNEIPDQKNLNGGALAKKLVAICHEEDPSRPTTILLQSLGLKSCQIHYQIK